MKLLIRLIAGLVGLVLLLVILVFAAQIAIGIWGPGIAASQIEDRSGFPATVEGMDVNLFSGKARITEARILNPEQFPIDDFIQVKEFRFEADPLNLMGDKVVVDELVLHLGTLGYVTTKDGVNNARTFAERVRPEPSEQEEEPKQEPIAYEIKHLVIQLDDFHVARYTAGEMVEKDIQADIRIEQENVTDIRQIIRPLTKELTDLGMREFLPAIVASLADLDVAGILPEDLAQDGVDAVQQVSDTIGGILKNTGQEGGEAAKQVGDALKNIFGQKKEGSEESAE